MSDIVEDPRLDHNEMKRIIKLLVEHIVIKRYSYDDQRFILEAQLTMNRAKNFAGLKPEGPLNEVTDLLVLSQVKNFLEVEYWVRSIDHVEVVERMDDLALVIDRHANWLVELIKSTDSPQDEAVKISHDLYATWQAIMKSLDGREK